MANAIPSRCLFRENFLARSSSGTCDFRNASRMSFHVGGACFVLLLDCICNSYFCYLFRLFPMKSIKFCRILKSITYTYNLHLYCMYCKRSGFRIQPMVEAAVVLVCRYTQTLLHHLAKFLLRAYVLCYIKNIKT